LFEFEDFRGIRLSCFGIISHDFWLLGIVITVIDYAFCERAAAASASVIPSLSAEAKALRKRFAIMQIVPWVVMGIGVSVGGVPDVWRYSQPQDLNPYVMTWFASVFCIAIMFAWWVFFRNGANKIVKYQLMSNEGGATNAIRKVKFIAALCPIAVAVWCAAKVSANSFGY
jgi:hypothetical protein